MTTQMADAFHTVPFAESCDDTITNGLSLCPNLHRAFDRGLVRIDEDYRVVVSAALTESEAGYSMREFEGKRILLPQNSDYWPSRENLARHWGRWG